MGFIQNFTQEGYITVGHFDSLGIAEGNIDPRIGKLLAIRLTVQSDSDNWVILSEVINIIYKVYDINLNFQIIISNLFFQIHLEEAEQS